MPDNAKSPPEPSMEEIIASISRIITEDKTTESKRPSEPAHRAPGEKSDVLELTEVVHEDGSVHRLSPAAGSPDRRPSGAEDPSAASPGTRTETAPSEAGAAGEPKLEFRRERILSSATSGAAAAAFAQLGALPRERRQGELPLGGADRTLEDVVRDLLRPYLETWLNERLPGMVERLVREEIARVIGEAGLR